MLVSRGTIGSYRRSIAIYIYCDFNNIFSALTCILGRKGSDLTSWLAIISAK